ncbi:unnamed protein product [Adineta steineri]|uniref:Methyltransferase type 11 domain-containing protein n=1 Tax=Adineta steineri TaxID=433720 RepID=A0A813VIN7_9BILA|nr:unnamed protein product [Adineta steineri]CAF0944111.1 unnamed protein product [Adineta steineri]CAF0977982.1 unnamed protein product [Adineta steineri]
MNYPLFVESNHTAIYKAYRPGYPQEIYHRILEFYFNTTNIDEVNQKIPLAIDIACGSGQATVDLSSYCHRVIGVDGSENQLKQATLKDNIEYHCSNAENLTFLPPNSIDLVTVATALHWFDIEKFFEQVNRILKPNGGVLSIWGTGLPSLNNTKALEMLKTFCHNDLKGCWSDRTHLVINQYESILDKFPYQQTRIKHIIEYERELSILQFVNVIETWSPCQKYRELYGDDKLKELLKTFMDNLVKCYTESTNDINDTIDRSVVYNKMIVVKWIIHLHLMKKQ